MLRFIIILFFKKFSFSASLSLIMVSCIYSLKSKIGPRSYASSLIGKACQTFPSFHPPCMLPLKNWSHLLVKVFTFYTVCLLFTISLLLFFYIPLPPTPCKWSLKGIYIRDRHCVVQEWNTFTLVTDSKETWYPWSTALNTDVSDILFTFCRVMCPCTCVYVCAFEGYLFTFSYSSS